jgi:hypothetical protein
MVDDNMILVSSGFNYAALLSVASSYDIDVFS